MHKEIEEARALIDGMDRAITQHGIAKAAEMFPQEETGLAAFTLLRNLLALFDRMQQEPGVEVENRDEKVFVNIDLGPSEVCKTCFLLVELRDAEHTLPYGRYRRELEDK